MLWPSGPIKFVTPVAIWIWLINPPTCRNSSKKCTPQNKAAVSLPGQILPIPATKTSNVVLWLSTHNGSVLYCPAALSEGMGWWWWGAPESSCKNNNCYLNSFTAMRVWAGTIKLTLVLFEWVRTHGGYQFSRTNLLFSHSGNSFCVRWLVLRVVLEWIC